jgi:hypothetical protein
MASRRQYAALALLLVGLTAVLNGMWLFPNEGEQRYTYERAELVVENGALERARTPPRQYAEHHQLDGVDCDRGTVTRDCTLDRYLLDEGPVTVQARNPLAEGPEYTRLGDDYYRRVVAANGSRATLDVERVDARTVRADLSTTVPAAGPGTLGDAPPVYRAVATGGPVTSSEPPHQAALGDVYDQNGTYYTAVVTDASELDRPLLSPTSRDLLSAVGIALLVVAVLALSPRRDTQERRPDAN